jgi:hypothetical protein
MSKLKVSKLRITRTALQRLQRLNLSLADLDLIICFSRKTTCSNATLFQFDPSMVPEPVRPHLMHLTGITSRAESGEIVDIYRDSDIERT